MLETFLANKAWLIIIAAWTLPWKGVALWRAVRLKDKIWFIVLLVVNTVGILEIVYIFVISKKKGYKHEYDNVFQK